VSTTEDDSNRAAEPKQPEAHRTLPGCGLGVGDPQAPVTRRGLGDTPGDTSVSETRTGTAQGREIPESGAGGHAECIPRIPRAKKARKRRFAGTSDAGGGTRTADTRTMIPQRFGSTARFAGPGGRNRGTGTHRGRRTRATRPLRRALPPRGRPQPCRKATPRDRNGFVPEHRLPRPLRRDLRRLVALLEVGLRSPHPELVDQWAPERVELVVADAARHQVGRPRRDHRQPDGLIDESALDSPPERDRALRTRRL
jgi:hypothetical protein